MKIIPCILVCFFGLHSSGSYAQKKISDFSIVYDYEISNGTGASKPVTGSNAIFVKGSLSRFETGNQSYSSSIIHDATTGNTVILKEVSGQKILIRLTLQNWKQMNANDEALIFSNTNETKTIAGYKCIRATAKTKDGSEYAVYFTGDLSVDNTDYAPQFKNLAGLALEYEITKGDFKIKYTVSKLNLNPVPESRFDIPKTGYREMTFEESKKLNFAK